MQHSEQHAPGSARLQLWPDATQTGGVTVKVCVGKTVKLTVSVLEATAVTEAISVSVTTTVDSTEAVAKLVMTSVTVTAGAFMVIVEGSTPRHSQAAVYFSQDRHFAAA